MGTLEIKHGEKWGECRGGVFHITLRFAIPSARCCKRSEPDAFVRSVLAFVCLTAHIASALAEYEETFPDSTFESIFARFESAQSQSIIVLDPTYYLHTSANRRTHSAGKSVKIHPWAEETRLRSRQRCIDHWALLVAGRRILVRQDVWDSINGWAPFEWRAGGPLCAHRREHDSCISIKETSENTRACSWPSEATDVAH